MSDDDRLDPFYAGMLRQIAKQIGWDKLRKAVDRLAAEDTAREEREGRRR